MHSNTLESPRGVKERAGRSRTRPLQVGCASRLRHVGRIDPAHKYPEVVLLLDSTPWHAAKAIDEALAANPHLRLQRLPSYGPPLNPPERLGVEPWAYLQDVLTRLPMTPAGELDDLLPDRWQAARLAERATPSPPAP